jgi:hypothetical protein
MELWRKSLILDYPKKRLMNDLLACSEGPFLFPRDVQASWFDRAYYLEAD